MEEVQTQYFQSVIGRQPADGAPGVLRGDDELVGGRCEHRLGRVVSAVQQRFGYPLEIGRAGVTPIVAPRIGDTTERGSERGR